MNILFHITSLVHERKLVQVLSKCSSDAQFMDIRTSATYTS